MVRTTALIAALLLTACGPSTTQQVCTPGASEACTCPAGADGVRTCLDDGSGFGGCAMCSGTGGGAGGGAGGGGGGGGGGSLCTLPSAPACGANARCDDTGGTAVCVCATGYQDNDLNGSCEPGCAVAGLTCAPHEVCDDGTGAAACVCAARYALSPDGGADGGPACLWGGAPGDPGFNETPAAAWAVSGGAYVDAGATLGTGLVDPGVLRFDEAVLCDDGGVPFATQTLDLPPFSAAEPMALLVSARTLNTTGLPQWWTVVNDGWISSTANLATAFRQQTACLGERAFQPGTALKVTANLRAFGLCGTTQLGDVEIDHLELRPAASCPAPGDLPNGDFEATTGWAAATTGTGATARLIADARVTGRGGRLTSSLRCASAALTAVTSPVTTASRGDTAVELSWTGSAGYDLHVELDGRVAAVLSADGGAAETARVCVGEWARGMVTGLTVRLPVVTTTNCLNAEPRDFVVDDVKWVSDPACAAPAWLFDGSFERTQATPWLTSSVTGAVAALDQNMGQARTGAGALRVELTRTCTSAEASQAVTVPPRQGMQGPAVKFWSRLPTGSSTTVSAVVNGVATTFAPTSNWRSHTVCLPAAFTGRAVTLALRGTSISATCNATQPAEAVYLDDVEVTTDPACPAQ